MLFRKSLVILIVLGLCAVPLLAQTPVKAGGADLFAKGNALLKQGDLDGAYQAFASAAKADPRNKAYAAKARIVRRVKALRKFVDQNEPSPKWEKMVLSLHAFYLQNAVYREALSLDRMAHAKMKNALSTSLLAETLLETGRNKEALDVVNGLGEKDLDLQNRIYKGIALARLGRMDEARAVAAKIDLPADADMGVCYDLARLEALAGAHPKACRLLVRCFEHAPPSKLDMVKGFVRTCPDFKSLTGTEGFRTAMATASKVKVSKCSEGAGCATCPNRSGCSSKGDSGEDCDSSKDKKEEGSGGE